MPPMEFNSAESFHASGSAAHGAESLAREVQSQVSAAANLGADKLATALPAPGADAALGMGAVPGSEQALSPLMSIIAKMPGHISLISSFFEGLASFFLPQLDMLSAFDPANMGLDSLFSPDHMGIDLSLLPDDAPCLNTLDAGPALNFGKGDFLSSKLNFSLGDAQASSHALSRDAMNSFRSMNVSGNLLAKPQFEGTGLLSGPSMQEGMNASHLASNSRLFSDSISGSSGNFANSMGAGAGSAMNVNGTNIGTGTSQLSGLTANANSLSAAGGLSDLKGFDLGSQKVGQNLFSGGSDNVLAYNNNDSFQSTVSAPKAETADLGGMKAKALSLDGKAAPQSDMKDAGAGLEKSSAHGKEVSEVAKNHPKEMARTHKSFDRASHSVKHTHSAQQPVKPANASASAAPKPVQQSEPALASQEAQLNQANGQQIGDQTANQNIAQDAGQAAPESTTSYTIKSGDCLWNIAKDQLGNATKWSDIYKMNEGILGANPDLIRPGTTIQLPGMGAEASANIASYTVKPGDNLWDIAREQLGDGSKWGDLYKANEGVIGSDPRLIQPGQELALGGGNNAAMQISAQPAATNMPVSQDPQSLGQTAMQQPQPSTQIQNYEMEVQTQPAYANNSMQNFEAAPLNNQGNFNQGNFSQGTFNQAPNQLPNQGALPAKVMPTQAQPDALIPPAHAADGSFTNFETLNFNETGIAGNKASSVNSNMGSDLFHFLNKRK
ncbi:MAG: LysM peptidoglycan-binding domain-containing protein [Candidatus Obscuribacter sp.]|nr:LysM peptidoglycan-binding domain-containing protein [Candidatus Obscuribacter sp.]